MSLTPEEQKLREAIASHHFSYKTDNNNGSIDIDSERDILPLLASLDATREELAKEREARAKASIYRDECERQLQAKVAEIGELLNENAALREAAKPLVWRKEPPTEEGFYYRRWNNGDGSRIVHVSCWTPGLRCFDKQNNLADVHDLDCEWAGPIPQPQEPSR